MRADGLVQAYMGNHAAAKECGHTQTCSIEKLVWDDEIKRRQIIAERSHRADGKDPFDSKHLQCADVCSVVNLAWRQTVPASVPRQECHAPPFKFASYDRVRWIAERSFHADFARVGESRHCVETA